MLQSFDSCAINLWKSFQLLLFMGSFVHFLWLNDFETWFWFLLLAMLLFATCVSDLNNSWINYINIWFMRWCFLLNDFRIKLILCVCVCRRECVMLDEEMIYQFVGTYGIIGEPLWCYCQWFCKTFWLYWISFFLFTDYSQKTSFLNWTAIIAPTQSIHNEFLKKNVCCKFTWKLKTTKEKQKNKKLLKIVESTMCSKLKHS